MGGAAMTSHVDPATFVDDALTGDVAAIFAHNAETARALRRRRGRATAGRAALLTVGVAALAAGGLLSLRPGDDARHVRPTASAERRLHPLPRPPAAAMPPPTRAAAFLARVEPHDGNVAVRRRSAPVRTVAGSPGPVPALPATVEPRLTFAPEVALAPSPVPDPPPAPATNVAMAAPPPPVVVVAERAAPTPDNSPVAGPADRTHQSVRRVAAIDAIRSLRRQ